MSARSRSTKDQINLIPQKGFETTTTGRVLAWILSTFRIIVIVTELIVMIAFLSRFWLDAQNTDLNEEIQQKQAILIASSTFENEFKDTQKRLNIFSEFSVNQGKISQSLKTITSYLPGDLYLTSARFSEGSFDIQGATPNEKSIEQLAVNLQSTSLFGKVTIGEIRSNTKDPYLLEFRIEASLSNE